MQPHFLPSERLKICEKEGTLWLKFDGQKTMLAPPKRALPLSNPDEFIVLSDHNGSEIGLIRRLIDLEFGTRDTLRRALEEAYRVIRISRILKVERDALSGQINWNVEVENINSPGESRAYERTFSIAGQEDISTARYPRIFFTDTDGVRYEIENCEAMDLASRRAGERYF